MAVLKGTAGLSAEPRHYNGWTDDAVKALRRLLRLYPPAHEIALRTVKVTYRTTTQRREGESTVRTQWDERKKSFRIRQGKDLQAKLEAVTDYLRGACRRCGFTAFWCVFIEHARDCGWHFHVWFDRPFPAAMDAAFKRWWNRDYSGADSAVEARYCYNSGTVRDVDAFTEYAGKVERYHGKGDRRPFRVKRRFSEYSMGLEGHFLPYRVCGHRRAEEAEKPSPDTRETDLGTSSRYVFLPESDRAGKPREAALVKDSNPLKRMEGNQAASYFYKSLRIGVRIAPLHGPNDEPILPPPNWALDHVRALCDAWTIIPEATRHPGPGWHPEAVELVFTVPPASVRTFERAAVGRFAKIFRP